MIKKSKIVMTMTKSEKSVVKLVVINICLIKEKFDMSRMIHSLISMRTMFLISISRNWLEYLTKTHQLKAVPHSNHQKLLLMMMILSKIQSLSFKRNVKKKKSFKSANNNFVILLENNGLVIPIQLKRSLQSSKKWMMMKG